jgi:small neutral amino acid transporter SnatA (MarC family)
MVLSQPDSDRQDSRLKGKDPLQLAVFPLAVPYLLNPAGIVILVTASAEAGFISPSPSSSGRSRLWSPLTWRCSAGLKGWAGT